MKIYQSDDNTIPVHSEGERYITIFLTPFPVGEKRNFRCNSCGKLLFQYESDVPAMIDNADAPSGSNLIEVLCHRCRVIYRIIS